MIEVVDGPAAGKSFAIRRAPLLLRLVHEERRDRWDALDQVGDFPQDDEKVFVYQRAPGSWGVCYVRPCGRYEMGRYSQVATDVDEAVLRETSAWQEWAVEFQKQLTKAKLVFDVVRDADGYLHAPTEMEHVAVCGVEGENAEFPAGHTGRWCTTCLHDCQSSQGDVLWPTTREAK
jgi:hypothetical protein